MSSNPVFKFGNAAVITGGASGIGLALATKCASYGMSVIIADNNSANLSSAKTSIKGKVETVEMDVSKIEDFEKLKTKVEKDFDGTQPVPPPSNSEHLTVNADDIICRQNLSSCS
jgi:short-subunit dehydrogenase involved in D-alanine esterification of teichoic acids